MHNNRLIKSLKKFGIIIGSIDRRIIYLSVALTLSLPQIFNFSLQPAKMQSAEKTYQYVETLAKKEDSTREKPKLVLLSLDWGPGTGAENKAQTEVIIEHLVRLKIPFLVISMYQYAAPFLESVPREVLARLKKENPQLDWVYGKHWINLGFRPNTLLFIQGLAKAENWQEYLKTDYLGTPLQRLELAKEIKDIESISTLVQISGLSGMFNVWNQFFISKKNFRPEIVHGCTSITIPEAYIFLNSGQIIGLFEGIAGAAWYEKLLSDAYPNRKPGESLKTNTSLAVAHLLIIFLIVIGNLSLILKSSFKRG